VACKKLKAHRGNYKDQACGILWFYKELPAINKYCPVKAGNWLAFCFGLRFDFLRYFAILRRDYEELSAG
jgi:hypothetical protein